MSYYPNCPTHRSLVKSTTTRVFPACVSSCSNSSSLVMLRTPPLGSGSWERLLSSPTLLPSSFTLSSSLCFLPSLTPSPPPVSFSFAGVDVGGRKEEDEEEGGGEEEVPAVSGSSLVPRLCGGACGVSVWGGRGEGRGRVANKSNQTAGTHTLLHLPNSFTVPAPVHSHPFHGNFPTFFLYPSPVSLPWE